MASSVTMKTVSAFVGTALLTSLIGTAVSGDPPWEWNIFTGWGLFAPGTDGNAGGGGTTAPNSVTVESSTEGGPSSSESSAPVISSELPQTAHADEATLDGNPTDVPSAPISTSSQQPVPTQPAASQGDSQPAIKAEAAGVVAAPAVVTSTQAAETVVTPPSLIGAVADLGSIDGMSTQVFFGPALEESALLPAAQLNLREGDPGRCVLTAVFNDVVGSTAAAWAGFAYSQDGWGSGEIPPSTMVASGNGPVHHEALTPPATAQPDYAITATPNIQIDGRDVIDTEHSYDLKLQALDGELQTWELNGQTVRCRRA